MGLRFYYGKEARFYPNFNLALFGKLDFTMTFWMRMDEVNASMPTVVVSNNYEQFNFFNVCLIEDS